MPEKRNSLRHIPEKHLRVFNNTTGEQLGLLANFSSEGIMLVTQENIKSSSIIKCRVELLQPILGHEEIVFVAHCCWSRKNISKHWWESGYKIQVTGINRELIKYLGIAFVIGKWKIPGINDVKVSPAENLRINTRYVVKDLYPVYQQFSYHEIGKLVNLSIEGACFQTTTEIKKGNIFNCKVKLPKTIFQRDYLIINAECKWCLFDDKSGQYKSGYQLQNVSEHDMVIILHLLMHFLEVQQTKQKFRIIHK